MSLNKKSVDDINVKGQRVLCRCDFNVPLKEGKITDENRLVAALGDGDACHAAAADNKNFAHDGTPLYFLLYDVYGCFVGANIVRPRPYVAAAAFPVGYGIRPYILFPDKVENVGRGLAPSAGRRGRRSLQGWLLTFPVPAAIPAAPCRPWPWKRRSGRAWVPARSRPRQ